MLSLFPLIFLLFCAVILRRYLDNWRAAILFAAIMTATVLTGITEALSLIQALSFYPLMISWLLLTAFAARNAFPFGQKVPAWPGADFKSWALSEKIFLVVILFVGVITAVTASIGAPNTWDSMTYHLPRVEHWIQDRTVAFYPTNTLRQLYCPPWAEYAITHVRILGGLATSVNFVQWSAMAGSLVGISLIAGQLGADRRGQLMSSAIATCLPMGILQSVSTQTDYVATFWLLTFVFFIIETQREFTLFNTLAVGASLGLAFLTKGYSYIYALPFLIWFAGTGFKKYFVRNLLGLLLIIACALSLNMGQYVRNTQAFGSPTWTDVSLTNTAFDLKVLWGNGLRNMSVHLVTPWDRVNEGTQRALTRAAQLFGADINDQRAIFGTGFSINKMIIDEDYSGNFFHAILFTVTFVLLWFLPRPKWKIVIYSLAVLSCFLLFCLIVLYQPWHSRFHLLFFVLFCPVAGIVLEHFLKQKSVVLVFLLFIGSMPFLFLNDQHPWFGRCNIWCQPKIFQYFNKKPFLYAPSIATQKYLASTGCQQIGLLIDGEDWEYPWWVLLSGANSRIEYVNVNNQSGSLKYPLGDFQPCVLMAHGGDNYRVKMVGSTVFIPSWWIVMGDNRMTVYLRRL